MTEFITNIEFTKSDLIAASYNPSFSRILEWILFLETGELGENQDEIIDQIRDINNVEKVFSELMCYVNIYNDIKFEIVKNCKTYTDLDMFTNNRFREGYRGNSISSSAIHLYIQLHATWSYNSICDFFINKYSDELLLIVNIWSNTKVDKNMLKEIFVSDSFFVMRMCDGLRNYQSLAILYVHFKSDNRLKMFKRRIGFKNLIA